MNIVAICFIIFVLILILRYIFKQRWIKPNKPFQESWRQILVKHVQYYNALSVEDKTLFEFKVHEFLLNYPIHGIKTVINDKDRMLVAASAIIPIFRFPDWQYPNLDEVLIYPHEFNEHFQIEGPDRRIMGMVGTGVMEGKMILSQKALHHGFENDGDKKNTAIHEFVHLIDKADGATDGIPALLFDHAYSLPWLDLINKKIKDIIKQKSDINEYGATSETEFFAVASEYFFERPQLLKRKHPELYALLEKAFNQKLAISKRKKTTTKRNDPCPCGSGLKFKKCCGQKRPE